MFSIWNYQIRSENCANMNLNSQITLLITYKTKKYISKGKQCAPMAGFAYGKITACLIMNVIQFIFGFERTSPEPTLQAQLPLFSPVEALINTPLSHMQMAPWTRFTFDQLSWTAENKKHSGSWGWCSPPASVWIKYPISSPHSHTNRLMPSTHPCTAAHTISRLHLCRKHQ